MPAAAWTTELETSGQVIFPQRRNRLLVRLAVGLLLLGNSVWSTVEHILDDDMAGVMGVLRLTSLSAFVFLVAWTGWQLITRRPVVTVDAAGIKVGRTTDAPSAGTRSAASTTPPASHHCAASGSTPPTAGPQP